MSTGGKPGEVTWNGIKDDGTFQGLQSVSLCCLVLVCAANLYSCNQMCLDSKIL